MPYTWSITKGSITTDGVVTVSGQCGTATITVKDKCDVTAEKVVTLPVVIGVSGPDAPVDGSQYTAITNPAGSNLDIQWSISKGSITQNGVVTISGQCGAAMVTAADNCGNTASKDVRMPGGTWVFNSITYAPYWSIERCQYTPTAYMFVINAGCEYGCGVACDAARGTNLYISSYDLGSNAMNGTGYPPCQYAGGYNPAIGCIISSDSSVSSEPYPRLHVWKSTIIKEWRCP